MSLSRLHNLNFALFYTFPPKTEPRSSVGFILNDFKRLKMRWSGTYWCRRPAGLRPRTVRSRGVCRSGTGRRESSAFAAEFGQTGWSCRPLCPPPGPGPGPARPGCGFPSTSVSASPPRQRARKSTRPPARGQRLRSFLFSSNIKQGNQAPLRRPSKFGVILKLASF